MAQQYLEAYLTTRNELTELASNLLATHNTLDKNNNIILDTRFLKIKTSEKALLQLRTLQLDEQNCVNSYETLTSDYKNGILPKDSKDMFLLVRAIGSNTKITFGKNKLELDAPNDKLFLISLKDFNNFVDDKTGQLVIETNSTVSVKVLLLCFID